jgi:MHS family proline/betaine transporter-like MFS transporter
VMRPSFEVMTGNAPAEEGHSPPRSSNAILAGIVGNVLEWYDFAVYGYFAPSIGRHFFPSEDPAASLIAAFGVFAAGFLMRPIGGLVFGNIGDKIGRNRALILSVLTMAVPTFFIGLLPDHHQIGTAAPVLLVLLRLLQGLAIGGEFTTSIVFLVESAPAHQRGFVGSWCPFGATAGVLLGSVIGTLITAILPQPAIDAWGWRVPFLLGLGVGVIGWMMRRHLPEPLAKAGATAVVSPIKAAFFGQWRVILHLA